MDTNELSNGSVREYTKRILKPATDRVVHSADVTKRGAKAAEKAFKKFPGRFVPVVDLNSSGGFELIGHARKTRSRKSHRPMIRLKNPVPLKVEETAPVEIPKAA